MKISINKKESDDLSFPVVMEHVKDGHLVLFTEPTTGILLDNSFTSVTTWIEHTDTEVWKKFKGTVTLSNED